MNYKFNLIPSDLDYRDILLESTIEDAPLPPSYSCIPKLLPIRDQGPQGSCSAMTAATIREYQEHKTINQYLSPQFVYNLRANKTTEGMTPRDTMRILHKQGILPESMYPYNTKSKPTRKHLQEALKLTIKSYATVHTIYAAKAAIITNGPIYIALPVYSPEQEQFWKPSKPTDRMLGGHAVCLVGYDQKGFYGRNSWGQKWGNKGYFFFPYTDWGHQWEIWTVTDETTLTQALKKPNIIQRIKSMFK